MKRSAPYLVCLAGIVALCFLIPLFNSAQPKGIRLTRGEARPAADAAARGLGIPVDKSWIIETWDTSPLLDKELNHDPERRRRAVDDPVIGPRLGQYRVVYHRRGQDKFVPYGYVDVSPTTGEVLDARARHRNEETAVAGTEAELRPIADAFVRTHKVPGAPNPRFESARPTVFRTRTDWTFRYRVPSTFPTGNVVPYLYVYFFGNKFAGWERATEYADGSTYRDDDAGEIGGALLQILLLYALLLLLLVNFLRKYHAGEVGIGTASLLFFLTAATALTMNMVIGPSLTEMVGLGSGFDAQQTFWAWMGFKFLMYDLPLSVLVFLAWAVGESYARERWGERLASFDAILRRDPLNATVGGSLLRGVLAAPAVAAGALLVAAIPLAFGLAYPVLGSGARGIVGFGGPITVVIFSAILSIFFPTLMLATMAFARKHRLLIGGVVIALIIGSLMSVTEVPIMPYLQQVLFGFGGAAVVLAIFLGWDLLSSAVALFFGSMLGCILPLLSVARGGASTELALTLIVPLLVTVGFALAGLMTHREVVYAYADLAPHVKRIVERERVKAEIDAANRIQAALLPLESPRIAGASFASHYRAATEIGGDYFDFLPQADGDIGIAFGDVSGHGLTSGIVMAMAKAALLVQVDYDSSPRAVLDVLNEIVIKTAPRRILMTFFFGLLDPLAQQLRFSSAGHLDPYVYRAATRRLEALSSWGFPLGVRRRDPFLEHTVTFTAGDRLVLYSDGLIEAVDDDGEPYGFTRFEATLLECGHQSAEEIKKALLLALRKFTHNRPPEDDQTLVVVSFDEVPSATAYRVTDGMVVEETIH